jgi:hypothetical protein
MRHETLWEGLMWAALTFFGVLTLTHLTTNNLPVCDITVHPNFTYTAGTGAQTANCAAPDHMLLHPDGTWEWQPPTP